MKQKMLVFLWLLTLPIGQGGESVLFIVGPLRHGLSGTNAFILPLDEPEDIRIARLLAASWGMISGTGEPGDCIPSFIVRVGSDGINSI